MRERVGDPVALLLVLTEDRREFNQVSERVAAEKARPIPDRHGVVGAVTGCRKLAAHALDVVDLKAEVAWMLRIGRPGEKVQLKAIGAGRIPHQLPVLEAVGRWDLRQAKKRSVESPHFVGLSHRIR